MRTLLFILVLLPTLSHAGYYELGFSGNYRKLYLPSDTNRESFDATVSYTGSFAYYFAEMAAAELSFTKGQSERFVPSAAADSRTIYDFNLIGLDIVLTFAERKADFIPYFKFGVAYFAKKEVTYEFIDNSGALVPGSGTESLPATFVPSLGFGLKVRLTKYMSFKIGLEAWTSDALNTEPRWDIAGRAGISWFL